MQYSPSNKPRILFVLSVLYKFMLQETKYK